MEKLTPERRAEIESEIKQLDIKQYAIKILINSIYGASGNKFFYFHNKDIAQSITLQGQDLILFSMRAVNHYFQNRWHLDTELHKKLGIEGRVIHPITKEAVIYGDTDSVYISVNMAIDSVEGLSLNEREQIEFCKAIIDNKLAPFLDSAFDKYAKSFHTINKMQFALENISYSGIWVAKKNYVLRVGFDGYLLDKPYLIAKGIDLAKAAFPKYARDKIEIIMNEMLDKGNKIDIEHDIVTKLREYRKMFDMNEIEDISFNYNVTKYNEYIISTKELKLKEKIPIRARASAYHNHLIEKTQNLKYAKIRQGNKVKFYYAKSTDNPEMNVFAFIPGNYPAEFALPMDYDEQFFRLVVEPINKQLDAMGMHTLNIHLRREIKIHMPRVRREITDDEMYPLYIINSDTLEYKEVPTKFNKYFVDMSREIPDHLMGEYVSIVTAYGLNTEITAYMERDKYIKRIVDARLKDKYTELMKQMPPHEMEIFEQACAALKEMKYKMGVNEETAEPTFTRAKTDKVYTLSIQNILKIKSVDNYIKVMGLIFKDEIEAEAAVLRKKLDLEAKKEAKLVAKSAAAEINKSSDPVSILRDVAAAGISPL